MSSDRSIVWFRRDLRLRDHPALLEAIEAGPGGVLGVYVLDPALWKGSGEARKAFLIGCLASLRADFEKAGGRFVVRRGKPESVLPKLAKEVGATSVHISADTTPYAVRRDERVEEALGEVRLVATGSPYAVTPGTLTKKDGTNYRVYTAFWRAWSERGVHSPAKGVRSIPPVKDAVDSVDLPAAPSLDADLPKPGETAALKRWHTFVKDHLDAYDDERNRPDLDTTSRMSAYLHLGVVHPRTLLADIRDKNGKGPTTYRQELCWRDFYGDVLWHNPGSAHGYYDERFARMSYDTGKKADEQFDAWTQGRTGYPIVDAGMRQLLGEGWMHNRVRMIVGSFLVKDLHQEWTRGAKWFLDHLVDGDVASNQHGWQWVAGCGTDAAPYFRIFNPVSQGERFDPQGDYVRRWVPELRGIGGKAVHTPWDADGGVPDGYPERIVDHKAERQEALERYAAVKG